MSVKPNHSRSHIHSSCYPFVTNHPSQWSSHTPTCLHYFLHLSALPVVLNGTHQIHNTATFTTYTSAALLLHLSPTHSQVFCLPSTFIPLLSRAHIHLLRALTMSLANISSWRLQPDPISKPTHHYCKQEEAQSQSLM